MKKATGKYTLFRTPNSKSGLKPPKPASLPPSKPSQKKSSTPLTNVASSFGCGVFRGTPKSGLRIDSNSQPKQVRRTDRQAGVLLSVPTFSVEISRAQQRNECTSADDSIKDVCAKLNSSQRTSEGDSFVDIKRRLNEKAEAQSTPSQKECGLSRRKGSDPKRKLGISAGKHGRDHHLNPANMEPPAAKRLNIVISSPISRQDVDLQAALRSAQTQLACVKAIWDAHAGVLRQTVENLAPAGKQKGTLETLRSNAEILLSPKVSLALSGALQEVNIAAGRASGEGKTPSVAAREKAATTAKIARFAGILAAVKKHKRERENTEERNERLVHEILGAKAKLRESVRRAEQISAETRGMKEKLAATANSDTLRRALEEERTKTRLLTVENEKLSLEMRKKDQEFARSMREVKALFEATEREKQTAVQELAASKRAETTYCRELGKSQENKSVHSAAAGKGRPASLDSQLTPTQPSLSFMRLETTTEAAVAEARFYKDNMKQLLALKGISQCLFKALLEVKMIAHRSRRRSRSLLTRTKRRRCEDGWRRVCGWTRSWERPWSPTRASSSPSLRPQGARRIPPLPMRLLRERTTQPEL